MREVGGGERGGGPRRGRERQEQRLAALEGLLDTVSDLGDSPLLDEAGSFAGTAQSFLNARRCPTP